MAMATATQSENFDQEYEHDPIAYVEDTIRNDIHLYGLHERFDTDLDLDGMDRYLLAKIRNLAHATGYCYAKMPTLAKMVGLSLSQVKRRLKNLEEKEAILRVYPQKNIVHIYPTD